MGRLSDKIFIAVTGGAALGIAALGYDPYPHTGKSPDPACAGHVVQLPDLFHALSSIGADAEQTARHQLMREKGGTVYTSLKQPSDKPAIELKIPCPSR